MECRWRARLSKLAWILDLVLHPSILANNISPFNFRSQLLGLIWDSRLLQLPRKKVLIPAVHTPVNMFPDTPLHLNKLNLNKPLHPHPHPNLGANMGCRLHRKPQRREWILVLERQELPRNSLSNPRHKRGVNLEWLWLKMPWKEPKVSLNNTGIPKLVSGSNARLLHPPNPNNNNLRLLSNRSSSIRVCPGGLKNSSNNTMQTTINSNRANSSLSATICMDRTQRTLPRLTTFTTVSFEGKSE